MKINTVLDRWSKCTIDMVCEGVTDSDVWAMARLSAIIAGKRAQIIGNRKYEQACYKFVRAIGGIPPKKKSKH